jgi:hypothetical protein
MTNRSVSNGGAIFGEQYGGADIIVAVQKVVTVGQSTKAELCVACHVVLRVFLNMHSQRGDPLYKSPLFACRVLYSIRISCSLG